MTLRELLRTPKMLDAIGGAVGVLLALALYSYLYGRPAPAHLEECPSVPYDVEVREAGPRCVRVP